MIPTFLFWRPWWVPTNEDRDKWRKEDKERAERDYPIEFAKFIQENETYVKLLTELEETFSPKQQELFLKAKYHAQQAVFHNQRVKHLQPLITEY